MTKLEASARKAFRLAMLACSAGMLFGISHAQSLPGATMLVEPPIPLLGPNMLGLQRNGDATNGDDAMQADPTRAAALIEDGLTRFSKASYGSTHVEAMQFKDATGAYAAWTAFLTESAKITKPDEKGATQIAVLTNGPDAGRTVALAQTVVLIAEKGAEASAVRKIVSALPKISGNEGLPPLLPTFFPEKGMVAGSVRYAVGPSGFAQTGMNMGAAGAATSTLGWDKNAEAAMAEYSDGRGHETLTLLLYPTPQLAGEHMRAIEATAHTSSSAAALALHDRREGELVVLAQGTFSADDAQNIIENVHLHNEVTFDKPVPPSFTSEIHKTYSLLTSIAVLFGVMGLAAVLLGFFLGGGRAFIRKLQGKDAATDAEFLSLHLAPQNQPAKFGKPSPEAAARSSHGDPVT